jgi:hypothetical protein
MSFKEMAGGYLIVGSDLSEKVLVSCIGSLRKFIEFCECTVAWSFDLIGGKA